MIEILDIDKIKLREFYRKIGQLAYFNYDGNNYIVTHGGISYMPDELLLVATEQLIKGVGDYNNQIDEIFAENEKDNNMIQVHGHRNTFDIDNFNNKSYNLEGKIEFGGYLKVLELEKGKEPVIVKIKNQYYVDEEEKEIEIDSAEKVTNESMVKQLRNSKNIKETKLDNNISSFNFTRSAFNKKRWDDLTCKARGLFVDVEKDKVVARGYEKFFNINEKKETELEHLLVIFNDKITCYKKENGFLGILSLVNDELFFASKSSNKSDYAGYFKDIFDKSDINKELVINYLKNNDVSLVFEVIDIINDPHIIKYDSSKIVLLDIIHNKYEFEKEPYEKVVKLAKDLNCECKTIYKEFSNPREFHRWYLEVTDEDDMSKSDIEGVVIESSGIMTKLKFPYYNFWKFMRKVKEKVLLKRNVSLSSLFNSTSNYFYEWLKKQDEETLKKDIITLRDMFYKENK